MEFILAFSRTEKCWKINAGLVKSWKSVNSGNKISLKTISAVLVLDFYFGRVYCFSYIILCIWEPWKNLCESWKSPGKLFLKKGTNPGNMYYCSYNRKTRNISGQCPFN